MSSLEEKALILINQGKINEAEVIYKELIDLGSKNPVVYTNLAVICGRKGAKKEKIKLLKKALIINPNLCEVHNNLGNALQDLENHKTAIDSYKEAIKLNPNYVEAYYNLGIALHETGDLVGAISAFKKTIRINSNFFRAFNNLGTALKDNGEINAAISSYEAAIKLNPNFTEAYNNLGIAAQEKEDIQTAIVSFKEAIRLNSNFTDAYWNLALAQLSIENYKNGLENYEWRLKKNDSVIHAHPNLPQWDKGLKERPEKLLVVSEQGLGDTIQFMRYIPYLQKQGIDVTFCAQKKLHSLIKSAGIHPHPITPEQTNQISNGYWIPLLSIPRHLKINPENPIIVEPYIHVTQKFKQKWRSILSKEQRPIIGINWQGNPDVEKNLLKGRSLSLESFSHIAKNNNYKLLSLQKGFGIEQLESCSFKNQFVSSQKEINNIWDFEEVAAIISNCDLIISSDTSIAHLAGGMGKWTWLLLHKTPEWRWGLKKEKTFWYSSMKLFRQQEKYNWNKVMNIVSEELENSVLTRNGMAPVGTVKFLLE